VGHKFSYQSFHQFYTHYIEATKTPKGGRGMHILVSRPISEVIGNGSLRIHGKFPRSPYSDKTCPPSSRKELMFHMRDGRFIFSITHLSSLYRVLLAINLEVGLQIIFFFILCLALSIILYVIIASQLCINFDI